MTRELIWKKKGNRYGYKVLKMNPGGGYKLPDGHMSVNIDNYKDVALFLQDLKYLWGVKIDSAIAEYEREKGVWPI